MPHQQLEKCYFWVLTAQFGKCQQDPESDRNILKYCDLKI